MIDYRFGVKLDCLKEDNLKQYFSWRNNCKLYQFFRQFEPVSWQHHRRWFDSLLDKTDVHMYEIIADGVCVGVCGLTDIDHINSRAEFTCYVDPSRQGSGFGKAALKTLFYHGFHVLNLNRIWGETFETNPAFDLFKSLGMTHEGTRIDYYFRDGTYLNAHLLSIGLPDFEDALTKDLGASIDSASK